MVDVPVAISEKARNIVLDLLPAKSRVQYEKEYDFFIQWKKVNDVSITNEDVILTYLDEKVRGDSLLCKRSF